MEFYHLREFSRDDVVNTTRRVDENLDVYQRFANEYLFVNGLTDDVEEFIVEERSRDWLESEYTSRGEAACIALVSDTVDKAVELEEYIAVYLAETEDETAMDEFLEAHEAIEEAVNAGLSLHLQRDPETGEKVHRATMTVPEEMCLGYRLHQELVVSGLEGYEFKSF